MNTQSNKIERFAKDFGIDRKLYPRTKIGKTVISFRAEHNANGSGGWTQGEPAISVPKWIVEKYTSVIQEEVVRARIEELENLPVGSFDSTPYRNNRLAELKKEVE